MIKRTKLLLTAVLAAAVLAGCGSSSASSSQASSSQAASSEAASSSAAQSASPAESENGSDALAAAVSTLLEADPISNPFELTAMNIEYDFGLKAEDVAGYQGVRSNDNGDAGLVLVIEPAAGKASDICAALETYKQDQIAFYGNYAEFAQAQSNVENAVICGRDGCVVMVIASNECTDTDALIKAVDRVVNG